MGNSQLKTVMTNVKIVNIQPEHAPQLRQLQLLCFPTVPPDELFHEEDFLEMADTFPGGTFVALGREDTREDIVGLGAGIYVDIDLAHPPHSLAEILDKGHDPAAPWYYGTDISVHPEWRGRGIGHLLYDARKAVVRRDNRRGIVAGGFIPGFANYKETMGVAEYVKKVVAGELYDPTLSFQLRHGFRVHGIIPNYMTVGNSDNFATHIVWKNPAYQESREAVIRK